MERNDLENAFQECLDALLNGDSVEEALSRHAEMADELEPLLETAALLATAELPAPSLAYQMRARAHFEAAVRDRNRRKRAPRGAIRWIFPMSAAATMALAVIAIGSATFLMDSGSPLESTSVQDGLVVLKPSLLQKADSAIQRIDNAIRNGDNLNSDDVKDLKDANDAIVKAVQSGSLDPSSRQAVQDIASKQLQVLAQIRQTEIASPGTPLPENSDDAKASITSVVTVVGKALGIPTAVVTPVDTVTPTEVPQPSPTAVTSETPVPTETVEATPATTPEPPTPEPTQPANAGQSAPQSTPASTATPTPTPSPAP